MANNKVEIRIGIHPHQGQTFQKIAGQEFFNLKEHFMVCKSNLTWDQLLKGFLKYLFCPVHLHEYSFFSFPTYLSLLYFSVLYCLVKHGKIQTTKKYAIKLKIYRNHSTIYFAIQFMEINSSHSLFTSQRYIG